MGEEAVGLGQTSMKCYIPVVPREGVLFSFLCTLSQFRWLILCCQSAACFYILSLLPNSQLSYKTSWTGLFQWFWTVAAIFQPWGWESVTSFLGTGWVSAGSQLWHILLTWRAWNWLLDSQKQVLPWAPGFSCQQVVSVVWCAVVADDWDSLTCDFLGKNHH